MQQFVETIKIKDGKALNLSFHQSRMCRTMRHFFADAPVPALADVLSPTPDMQFYKARVLYDGQGVVDVQYAPYTMREIRSLKVVVDDRIDYSFKSADRSSLNRLTAQKGDCDEIIIVKNGLVTDTSFTNIAVFDGEQWLTPRHPLLMGTKRASLLEKHILKEADISVETLMRAQKVSLINAMIDLGEREIALENVIGFRPPSNQIPSAVQSDSVRRPIRFRSPSNQIPFATYRLLMSDKVANHAPSFRSEYRLGVELYAVHIVGAVS